jgi:hypothetical protein
LCGYFGVDHYNIIEGALNALELLQFFTEALEERHENGKPKLAVDDLVASNDVDTVDKIRSR